jgi:DNA-binding transcriptional LysR family regulator
MDKLTNLDSRRLRVLVSVVEEGSFSSAARKLFTTQSTASKAVKQLEEDLGVILLERSGPRVRPTDAGAFVYERARRILVDVADLGRGLDEIRGVRRGSLSIGFPRLGVSSLFAMAFANFRALYPMVDVQILPFGVPELVDQIRTGKVDFGVMVEPLPEDLDSRRILSAPVAVLLPPGSALGGRDRMTPDQLGGAPLIMCEEGMPMNDVILEALRKPGEEPRIAARTSQIDLLFELVAAGVGIGFVPGVLVRTRRHETVRTVELQSSDIRWNISYVWRRGGYLSHAARAWLDRDMRTHEGTA